MSFDLPEQSHDRNELHEYALHAYRSLLEHRGADPLLRANADETKRWLEQKGFPTDDPDFLAATAIGALTVYQKAEQQAFVELDEGPTGRMSEVTRASGQMATGAVIELGMLLEDALKPAE
jgi:hypothetical protein